MKLESKTDDFVAAQINGFIVAMETDFYINLHRYDGALDVEFKYTEKSLVDLVSIMELYSMKRKNSKSIMNGKGLNNCWFHIIRIIDTCTDSKLKKKVYGYLCELENISFYLEDQHILTLKRPWFDKTLELKIMEQQHQIEELKELDSKLRDDAAVIEDELEKERAKRDKQKEHLTNYKVKSDTYV